MAEEKKYELKQVSVRLKLCEEPPLYSTEQINTPRRAIEVMKDMMRQLDREYVCVVNLDNGNRPINFNVVSIGTINSSIVSMRELLKSALLSNSKALILLHNHPSYKTEKPQPSHEDDITTLNVMIATQLTGLELIDHVIVSGGTGSLYSYKEELRDRFSIEGLQEIAGRNAAVPVLKEAQPLYGTQEAKADDLGPKRVVEPPEKESGDDEGRESVDEFRAETEKHFTVIGGMTAGQIEEYVRDKAEKIFEDYGMEAEVTEAVITGSRCRGLEKAGSDLDIMLEYRGEEPKDVVAAFLNDEKLIIGGVRVDISPLQKDKDESLENYLRKEREKFAEAEKKARERKPGSIEERPSVREKLRRGRIAMETAKRQSMIKQARLKTERAV